MIDVLLLVLVLGAIMLAVVVVSWRWIHVSQWTATRPTPPASQGDVAFELEQRK